MSSSFVLWLFAASFLCGLQTSSSELDLRIEPAKSVQYIATGSSLHLKCNVTRKNISLQWRLNGMSIYVTRTTLAVLNITRMKYINAGKYTCVAKDLMSHIIVAERSVQIDVGDPPPEPPPPVLKHLFGLPPVAGFMTFVLPSASPHAYPMTIALLLSHTSMKNFCGDPKNPQFQVVDQNSRTFRNKENLTFLSNISSTVKMLFPRMDQCQSPISCDILCATVRITNRFGCQYVKPEIWPIKKRAECGKVDELRAIQINKKSIVIGWKTPRYMIHSSHLDMIWYKIWCDPDCGGDVEKKNHKADHNKNYTVRFLYPHSKVTIKVSCKVYGTESLPPAMVTVWTQQDVPSKAPVVKMLQWLGQQSSKEKGVALITWEGITDNTILRGKLESYEIKVLNVDKPYSKPLTLQVAAGNTSLVTESLEMANYNFTIKACTGAGCGKESYPVFLSALVVKDLQHNPVPQKDNSTIYVIVGIVCLLVVVFALSFAVWFFLRNMEHPRPPLPRIDRLPNEDGEDNSRPTENTTYSIVNGAFSASNTCINKENDDKAQPSASNLSRASSTSTCSTDI